MIRRSTVLLFALALSTGGCGGAELEELRREVATEREAIAELREELERVRADARAQAANASDARAQVRLLQADAQAQAEGLAAREAELVALRTKLAKIDPDEAQITLIERELKEVRLHRDELVEWIETELLPAAEERDPRLVELRTQTAEMAKAVEEIRGLKFKRPFMRRLIRREQVGEWMRRDLRRELPEDEAKALVAVSAKFGMMDPQTDVYALFSGFLEDAAAAFYKSETGTFYLIEGKTGGANNPVIFHELVHAADDQYYDLAGLSRAREEDSDAGLAVNAVVEGCADLFQTRYHERRPEDFAAMMKAERESARARAQSGARAGPPPPVFLIAMMALYPYKNGSAFLRALGVKDAEDVDRVFRDPPASTEQVLHPEKFALDGPRDYPHAVAVPDIGPVLGEGWSEIEDSNFGELGVGLLLAHVLHPGQPRRQFASIMDPRREGVHFQPPIASAAAGWDGDRYVAYQREASGEVCVVWTSRWDTEKDAREFAKIYGSAVGRRVTGEAVRTLPSPIRFEERGGTLTAIQQDGPRVVVVLGGPPAVLEGLLDAGASVSITPDARDAADAAD